MTTDNGGAAFPHEVIGDFMGYAEGSGEPFYQRYTEPGMTLRDWFAGQVIQGLLRDQDDWNRGLVAVEAYRIADAMIAEREKGAR